MPQKRSGATAGLEESGGSAGGAECRVTARRAWYHASSQLPDRLRARGRTTTARTAPATVPRVTPTRLSRRAAPLRGAPSAARAPSASAARRRRSPRAILARRAAWWELVGGCGGGKGARGLLRLPAGAQRREPPGSQQLQPARPGRRLRFRSCRKSGPAASGWDTRPEALSRVPHRAVTRSAPRSPVSIYLVSSRGLQAGGGKRTISHCARVNIYRARACVYIYTYTHTHLRCFSF